MHDTHNDHHARYYCYKCLHGFTSEELLNGHLTYYNCADLNCPSRIKFPDEKKSDIYFKNYQNQFRCPFVIYADFEALLQNTDDDAKYNKHIPSMSRFLVVSDYLVQ